jgi:hypothetical protein
MSRRRRRRRRGFLAAACAVLVLGAAIGVAVTRPWESGPGTSVSSVRYVGVFEPDAPASYAGVDHFAQGIGGQPNLVSYYSAWQQPFDQKFAATAAAHGADPLVQMDPKSISLTAIGEGKYDSYLTSFAAQVKAFGHPVVISFGHEMNGYWYSWGHQYTKPATFVTAWKHVVNVFRAAAAANVKWLWTVNVVDGTQGIPNPTPWWPGRPYVDWVGIDGYYQSTSEGFGQVFGPTIVDVRQLSATVPILISETGGVTTAGQQASITDLFAGVRTYGLLGFLWFDEDYQGTAWRITSPRVFATFRQQMRSFFRPASPSPRG